MKPPDNVSTTSTNTLHGEYVMIGSADYTSLFDRRPPTTLWTQRCSRWGFQTTLDITWMRNSLEVH
eukprot:m.148523 g.148523  ORF g.148523 m.148523 type:complete len:66 (-) comp17801_c0_seq14:1185-1382(-)